MMQPYELAEAMFDYVKGMDQDKHFIDAEIGDYFVTFDLMITHIESGDGKTESEFKTSYSYEVFISSIVSMEDDDLPIPNIDQVVAIFKTIAE